jgi:hypothetical protein
MSSLPLTNFKHLLSMGPKFIPYQRIDPTNNEIISNFQSFTRNLKIKKHFYKKECLREIPFSYDNSWTRVIKLPSQWIPPLTHEQFEPFNNDLQLMEADFYRVLRSLPEPLKRRSTLLNSIRSITELKSIRITNSDKNLGFCVLDNDHYIQLCLEHIADPDHYQLLTVAPHLQMLTLNNNLDQLIKEWFFDLPLQADYITHSKLSHQIPNFYILPKIHKKGPLTGRPLTGAFNAPTTAISKILRPYLNQLILLSL